MIDKNDSVHPIEDDKIYHHSGISLREYLSAMAMQGILAGNPKKEIGGYGRTIPAPPSTVAYDSVRYADELIKELNK